MTASDETIYGSYTPNGSARTFQTVTVPDGETWYVDALVTDAMTGNTVDDSHRTIVEIVGPNGGRIASSSTDQNNNVVTTSAVGMYCPPGYSIEVRTDEYSSESDVTVAWSVLARRVV